MTSNLLLWASNLSKEAIPFLPHGRTRRGLDCWGVVWLADQECLKRGIPSHSEDYQADDLLNLDTLNDLFKRSKKGWLEVNKPLPGDVILLRMAGRPVHVGLVLGQNKMLHIEKGINLCVENYGNTLWRNRIAGFYRFGTI